MSTPDTLNYMIAGYVVIFVVLVSYVASLWARFRKRRQEAISLEERIEASSQDFGAIE